MRQTLTIACVCLFSVSINALADDAAPCQVRVILFVPSDVTPPKGYQQRMDQIVDHAESFFHREFKRWGRSGHAQSARGIKGVPLLVGLVYRLGT